MNILKPILFIIFCLYSFMGESKILQSFYTSRDGLLSNTVDYITKDSSGTIYLSTPEGLVSYTGSEFFVLKYSDEIGSIPTVTSMVELDRYNTLICSSEYGLFLYNKRKQSFKSLSKATELKDIVQVHKDNRGVLWVASSKGKVWYLSDYRDMLSEIINLNFVEVDYVFPKIKGIGNLFDKLYVCTASNEFVFLEHNGRNVNIEHILLPDNINTVYTATPISNSDVFIGTNDGILHINLQKNNTYNFDHSLLRGRVVRCIENTSKGVFIGTEGDGLYVYYEGKVKDFKFDNIQNNKNLDYIISSFYDDGDLWLGTWNGGLVRLSISNKVCKIIYNSKSLGLPLYIWSLESFPQDSVTYVGTHNNGLACFTPSMNEYTVIDKTYPLIKSLYADTVSGHLYVGTFGNGLREFNLSTKKYTSFNIREIENERIYVIYPYSKDKLLIGTAESGLWLYDKTGDNAIHINILSNYDELNVRDIKPDLNSEGLWISTFNNGLYHLNLNSDGSYSKFSHIESADGIDLRTTGLYNDKDCTLVTTERGLYKIIYKEEGYEFGRIRSLDGLRLNNIIRHGEYYVVTSYSGVYFLNDRFEILSILCKGESANDLRWNHYTEQLEIAETSGIMILNKNNIGNLLDDMKISLQSISINGNIVLPDDSCSSYLNEAIEYTERLNLRPTDDNIALTVSCLLPHSLYSTYIYYMMEGLHNEWNRIPMSNAVIRYNNIPSGDYKLRIRIQSKDNINGERVLNIVKDEFWYKTSLAISLYIISLILFIAYIIFRIKSKERTKFFNRVQEIEERKKIEIYDQKLKFITNISHDLKTPLTLILSPLNDMRNMPDMPEKFKPRLESMIQNGDNLLRKINKIINYRDLEVYDESAVDKREYFLQQLFYEIVMPFKAYSESQGIEFVYSIDETENNSLIISTDKSRLESILENLISNAIKYTPKGGQVCVKVVSDNTNLHITVSDTGRGISEQDIPHIFDRYYCAVNSKDGTGIGLYLVKRYVEMLEGNISINSSVGKGTTFTIDLPVVCKSSSTNINNEESPASDNIMKLLFVEDNKELRDFFAESFSSSYNVFTASSAGEGIEIAKRELPDLIVSDYMMPETDGLELCRILKNEMLTSHIPFVMLSSLNTEEFRKKCWQEDVDLFEEKPFKTEFLKIKFATLIKNRMLLKNKYQYPVTDKEKKKVENELSEYNKKFMDELNSVIDDNLENSELSIEELAGFLKMSHDQLYRKIKALTGVSANQYIRSFRLRKAAKMMCENKCSVTEVLYTVGFSNPSYFTKCFKKEFGVRPSEYIEENS